MSIRAARLFLWLVCVALQLGAIRNMWFEERVPGPQMFRGMFEDPHGRPELALVQCCGEEFFPGPGLDANGAIAVSPGLVAVANLADGGTFVVRTDDATPAPYVVFGTQRTVAGTDWLSDPRQLVGVAPGLQLAPWDGAQPWRADARWLAALSEHCGGADTRSLRVSSGHDRAEVRLGSCPPTVIPVAAGDRLLMAVIAGPSWITIAREGTGYRVARHVNTGVLIRLLPLAAISVAGLAAIRTGLPIVVSVALFVASFIVPFAAWVAYIAVPVLVVIVVILKLSARVLPFRRRALRLYSGFMCVVFLFAGIILVLQRVLPSGFSERHWTETTEGPGDTCQLIGYSGVDNAQLRDGGGVSSILSRCRQCRGGLEVAARHGGRLDWTRRQACSPSGFSSDRRAVVAIGGDNDDMIWAQTAIDYVRDAVTMLSFGASVYDRTVRPDRLSHTIDAFAASAVHSGDAQAAALRAAAQCARDRRARFVFVHDLFIEDVTAGRSKIRQALLERRRDAVAPDGRARFFVDLLEAFPGMGVSWFNDMRHPSLIGHRKIAEHVCGILEHASAGGEDGPVP